MNGLTIGQVARLAGVSIKTIRHYHRKGLLAEPPRDRSGYRRYRSQDILRLVEARALASAGVALDEVSTLLAQDPAAFQDSLEQIEAQLSRKIEALEQRRELLRRMQALGPSWLPKPVLGILKKLESLNFAPQFTSMQRDSMVLAAALAPEFLETYVEQMHLRLNDSEYVALMKQLWEALSWNPEDPRLEALAKEMADLLLAKPDYLHPTNPPQSALADRERYQLINHFAELPAAMDLTRRIEDHLRHAGIEIPTH